MDRDTGRSKGFGFVEMGSDQEAQDAIKALGGKQSGGRALTVNEAKPREDRGGAVPGAAVLAAAGATKSNRPKRPRLGMGGDAPFPSTPGPDVDGEAGSPRRAKAACVPIVRQG